VEVVSVVPTVVKTLATLVLSDFMEAIAPNATNVKTSAYSIKS
jgi:hypothetical protein